MRTLGTRVLCVLLPTMTLLLSDTQSVIVSQTIKQLLNFAASAPAAFKDATAQLDPSAREVLEQSLRKAVAGSAPQAPVQPVLKPQISLRSF
jgi:HEAT repeat-containing protein 5